MNRIRELRKKKGMSQAELSAELGIAQPTLSGYETESTQPDIDMLRKIAACFHVSMDYLLGADPIPVISNTEKVVDFPKPKIQDEVELNDLYPVPLIGQIWLG